MIGEQRQKGLSITFYGDKETAEILNRRFPEDQGRKGKKSDWIRSAIKDKDRKERK